MIKYIRIANLVVYSLCSCDNQKVDNTSLFRIICPRSIDDLTNQSALMFPFIKLIVKTSLSVLLAFCPFRVDDRKPLVVFTLVDGNKI